MMFHTVLRRSCDWFPKQYQLFCLCVEDAVCDFWDRNL